jgi:hypothetical protein
VIGTDHLTQIHGFRDAAKHSLTEPGQAFFGGSGPAGETCEGCKHFQPYRTRCHHGTCRIYRALMPHIEKAPGFDADASACKFFSKDTWVCRRCRAGGFERPAQPPKREVKLWQN